MKILEQIQTYVENSGLAQSIGMVIVIGLMTISFALLNKIEKWFR